MDARRPRSDSVTVGKMRDVDLGDRETEPLRQILVRDLCIWRGRRENCDDLEYGEDIVKLGDDWGRMRAVLHTRICEVEELVDGGRRVGAGAGSDQLC